MRKRKTENLIFDILFVLPLLVCLVYFVIQIVSANNHDVTLSVLDIWTNLGNSVNNGVFAGPVYDGVHYFFAMFNVSDVINNFISIYIQYIVFVELVHILFDLFIFIPNMCRRIISKGVDL